MHLSIYIVSLLIVPAIRGALEDKFRNYELINSVRVHTTTKRSTGMDNVHTKEVSVSLFGRNMTLNLRPTRHLFSPKFKIAVVHGDGSQDIVKDFKKDNFLTGTVEGEPNSRAAIHLDDNNRVTGVIQTREDEFTIEPVSNHKDSLPADDYYDPSTMVAYRRKDIKVDAGSTGTCGATRAEGYQDVSFKTYKPDDSHHRARRATSTANTCYIMAVADYKFYQHLGENNIFVTANYIANILNRVNLIYRSTDFSNVGAGFGFELEGMVIHDGYSTSPDQTTYYYNINKNNWGTTELLQAFGRTDSYADYCLGHLFTSQSMPDSVLGLAYIASASRGAAGGLCSNKMTVNGFYSALNNGWSSAKNKAGSTVSFSQLSLVTAHEFGHNWGSEHDPSGDCSPGSILGDGKYLMYQTSVTGEDPNNDKFSSCSKSTMGGVLANKASGCLKAASVADPCGNGRIDAGEECDGGFLGSVGLDPCCSQTCTLNIGATCSPVNYPCCKDCQLAAAGYQCQTEIDGQCLQAANCDGTSLQCPDGAFKPDGTECLDSGSCSNGVCISFCEFRQMNSCLCDAVDTSCKKCCRSVTTGVCSVFNTSLFVGDGRSCIQGYCENGVCIKAATTTMERFWELIDMISIDFLVESFKTNIVACITGFSLVIYFPVCVVIWCIDRRRRKNWERLNSVHVRRDRNLAHDEDKRPIVANEKPPATSKPATLDPSEFLPSSKRPSSRNQIQPLGQRSGSSIA